MQNDITRNVRLNMFSVWVKCTCTTLQCPLHITSSPHTWDCTHTQTHSFKKERLFKSFQRHCNIYSKVLIFTVLTTCNHSNITPTSCNQFTVLTIRNQSNITPTSCNQFQLGRGWGTSKHNVFYPIYYANDDMFRPLSVIFRSQKCI